MRVVKLRSLKLPHTCSLSTLLVALLLGVSCLVRSGWQMARHTTGQSTPSRGYSRTWSEYETLCDQYPTDRAAPNEHVDDQH